MLFSPTDVNISAPTFFDGTRSTIFKYSSIPAKILCRFSFVCAGTSNHGCNESTGPEKTDATGGRSSHPVQRWRHFGAVSPHSREVKSPEQEPTNVSSPLRVARVRQLQLPPAGQQRLKFTQNQSSQRQKGKPRLFLAIFQKTQGI